MAKSVLESRVAVNMKGLRVQKQLSQAEVAEKANISVSYVSMLERGRRSPPLETVEILAKVFKLKDPADFLQKMTFAPALQ